MSNIVMTKEDKIKMFDLELNYINDADLKSLAIEIIANADDYFFTIPASSTGKNHPQFDLGEGGLVRHTRCVVYMARCMAESFGFSNYDKDTITVAALAHDIKKQGEGDKGVGYTIHNHPILASQYVSDIWSKIKSTVPLKIILKIMNAISSHMGKWGHLSEYIGDNRPLPKPNTQFAKILHAADYIASRKALLDFDFNAKI